MKNSTFSAALREHMILMILTMALLLTALFVLPAGAEVDATPLTLNTDTTATISAGGQIAYFSFTPEETGTYIFSSSGSADTYGYLYNASLSQITSDDDSGQNNNFQISRQLTAGTLYYFGARYYNSSSTGSFHVLLHKNTVTVANGTCGDNLTWTLDDAGTLTISGAGQMADYTYSSSAPWYSRRSDIRSVMISSGVTSIGSRTFYGCSGLTSITIPGSVTSIGNYAFSRCSGLTSITIPGSVTSIGSGAFSGCSGLTSITIPGSVTIIGDSAFYDCSGLKTAGPIGGGYDYEFGWTSSIPSYAFYECSSLTSVTIPGSVRSIGFFAFSYCSGLTSITIPGSVTSIDDYAFYACSGLTGITIPNSVTSIGSSAFSGCSSLTSITIPGSVTSIGSYYNSAFSGCSGLKTAGPIGGGYDYEFGWTRSIPRNAFSGSNLTSIFIPSSITSIGDSAFYNCSGLTSISIPSSVTSIGSDAFRNCSGLTSICIPSSVTSIGSDAFRNCSGLTSICIPSSVTSIGDYAFAGCSGLTYVTVPPSVIHMGESVFTGCDLLADPDDFIIRDHVLYGYTGSETSVIIPYGITGISGAFQNRNDLISVTIPNSVTSIGISAFSGCSGLTGITIPDSVTSIGSYAFDNCSGLISITIPSSVTSIGSDAFYGCSGLKTAGPIGGGYDYEFGWTSSIPSGAFYNCSGLTSITIPGSVTSIGYRAFYGCSGLTNISIPGSVTSIGSDAFYGCSGLKTAGPIGGGYNIEFGWTSSIPSYAFCDCYSLTSITIPDSVTSIGSSALSGCSRLSYIAFSDNLSSIGENAFSGCPAISGYGACGENLVWILETNGKLLILGNGDMYEYGGNTNIPWRSKLSSVRTIEVADGVTSTSSGAFYGCNNLTKVTIPGSVTSLGELTFPRVATALKTAGPIGGGYNIEFGWSDTIPRYAFMDCTTLTGITLPNSISCIEYGAFYECSSLKSISLPSSITTISTHAFAGCTALTSITIPFGVTDIGANAFAGCSNLTSVIIPSSVRNIGKPIPDGSAWSNASPFTGCSGLTTAGPNGGSYKIKFGWTNEIPDHAFQRCSSLTNVTIPNSITSIGSYSFENCTGIANITLPSNVAAIGENAFASCSGLTSIIIPDSTTEIGNNAFNNCIKLASASIPCSINPTGVFQNNTQVTIRHQWSEPVYTWSEDNDTVTATRLCRYDSAHLETETVSVIAEIITPATCTEAGQTAYTTIDFQNSAFSKQSKILTDISAIGHQWNAPVYTWSNDNSTITATRICAHDANHIETETVSVNSEVTNPATATRWGQTRYTSSAFSNEAFSVQLKTVTDLHPLEWEIKNYGNYVIITKYYGQNTNVHIPSSLEGLPVHGVSSFAFADCENVSTIYIPESVTYLDTFSLFTTNLKTIQVDTGNTAYTSVNGVLFNKNITNLICYPAGRTDESYQIPKGLNTCSEYAFAGAKIRSVTIPASVTAIGEGCFFGSLLETIVYTGYEENYPNMIIGNQFDENFENVSLVFPTTVAKGYNYIGRIMWILHTDGLLSFSGEGSMSYGFSGDSWLVYSDSIYSVVIHEGITSICDNAFSGCSKLIKVELPESLSSIGYLAFSNCSNLTSITIPDNVTSIDWDAFEYCTNLTSVTFPASLTLISESVFYGCASLKNVDIPGSVISIGQYAFADCESLTSISIPDSVTSISEYAFSRCSSLTKIVIPNSITSIGENPFPKTAKVYCYEYSYAESWAEDNGYTVVLLDNTPLSGILTVSMPAARTVMAGTATGMDEAIFPRIPEVNITWTSSNNTVASVDADGRLTAHQPGTATITLNAGGKIARCTVTVVVGAESFELEPDYYVLAKKTLQAGLIGLSPADAVTELTWSTGDTVHAAVSATGLITGKAVGETMLTVTDAVSGLTRTAAIHICYPVSAITLTPSAETIFVGLPASVTANVTMNTQTCVNQLVTFSSNNPSVAAVDQDGNITALKPGTVTITARAANGISASCTLTVVDHQWEGPIYVWSPENNSVTATMICLDDDSLTYAETVSAAAEVTKPATCEEPGETTYTSGAFESPAFTVQTKALENLSALGHWWNDPVYTWAEDNTSVTASHVCARDETHTETETVSVTAEVITPVTCEEDGQTVYTSAGFTNSAFEAQTKTVDYTALGHDWSEPTYTWADDHSSVTASRVCAHDETHAETETVPVTAEVTLPATCTEAGQTTYTSAAFENEAFAVQTMTLTDLEAIGHEWGNPEYTWAEDNTTVTASRVCLHDASHTETETVPISAEVTRPATCTDMGQTTYTASFESEVFETQTKTLTDIAALGHDWSEPAYTWADDHSSVTASRVCSHDETHTETETVPVTAEITFPATCTEAGQTTYTSAAFENEAFAAQTMTLTDIEAIGHEWGNPEYTWAEDNTTVTASRVCLHDASHTETETVPVTAEVTRPATCTDMGQTTYTASFESEVFETQTKTLTDIDALGHDWSEPAYTWADNHSSVTASRVCAHDETHTETETVPVTAEVTLPPTCTEAGQTTYTSASFTNEAFAAQTMTLTDIEAIGHEWGNPEYTWAEDNTTVTASRVCLHDTSHAETETVPVTAEITRPATCTDMGQTTYTASFESEVFETQTKTLTDIDALGHDWSEPVYTWADDHSSVTASRVCSHNETHTETETVPVTAEVTLPATCTEPGQTTYTSAAFKNEAFAIQTMTLSNIEATGHTVVTDPAVSPTCTEPGHTEGRHCSVCGEVFDAPETIEPLGHDGHLVLEVPAGIGVEGFRLYECARCGERYTESIEALPEPFALAGRTWTLSALVRNSKPVSESSWGNFGRMELLFSEEGTCTFKVVNTSGSLVSGTSTWSVNGQQVFVPQINKKIGLSTTAATLTIQDDGTLLMNIHQQTGASQCTFSSGASGAQQPIDETYFGLWQADHLCRVSSGALIPVSILPSFSPAAVQINEDLTVTVDGVSGTWSADDSHACTAGGVRYVFQVNPQGQLVCRLESGDYAVLIRDGQSPLRLSVLNLPAQTNEIGEEAFAGIMTEEIAVPSGCVRIGSKAFAGCGRLRLALLPASVRSIADDAFEGCTLTIIVPAGSYAVTWAQNHGVDYLAY